MTIFVNQGDSGLSIVLILKVFEVARMAVSQEGINKFKFIKLQKHYISHICFEATPELIA